MWLRPYFTNRGFLSYSYEYRIECKSFANLGFLVLGGSLRNSLKTDFLLLNSLRSILVQQLEQLSSRVLVESM